MKDKPHVYKVGDKLWINKSLFKDGYVPSQKSDKLNSKRFGPFPVTRLISKNVVELKLPDHVKIDKVVNVSHTVPYYEQPDDIRQPLQPRPGDGTMNGQFLSYIKSKNILKEKWPIE